MTKKDLPFVNPIEPVVTPAPFKATGLIIGIFIGILLTATSASAVYFYLQTKKTPVPQSAVLAPTAVPTSTLVSTPALPSGNISWLDKPLLIKTPPIFIGDTNTGYLPNEAKIYQAATFANQSKLLLLSLPFEGPGLPSIIRLVVDKNGNYTYLRKSVTDEWVEKSITEGKIFIFSVQPNDLDIAELQVPREIKLQNGNKLLSHPAGGFNPTLFVDLKNAQLVESSPFYTVYSIYTEQVNYKNIFIREFYLKLNDGTVYPLTPQLNFFSDNQIPYLSWSDNTVNSDKQFSQTLFIKCGAPYGSSVIKNGSQLIANKIVAGKISTNDPIYQVKGVNEELVKELYDNYKNGRDYPSAPPILSIEDFDKKNTHFLYQDKQGDWLIFINSDYQVAAECGKPVIYLYPQKDTQVSVQVGANITKSDPLYPLNGWTVLAHPNGSLDYQDQSYPYLFWEGQGNGFYPDYQNQGFVVAQNELLPTLKSHLLKLGLNAKESADFIEFWQPRLPSTPYVRLTWLGTSDMNRLAPLVVTPRPDTTIRLFLDFAGLDKPVVLKPQNLSAPSRRGFTLVEWGGLLQKP